MSNQEYIIDLCSDEEIDAADVTDVKPVLLSSIAQVNTSHGTENDQPKSGINHDVEENRHPKLENGVPPHTFCMTEQASIYADGFSPGSGLTGSSTPICRQFWKSGDYEVGQALGPVSHNGLSRLRIHPKFLHSNATSHKWAFGAIAELLDNAVDEVQKGATFVAVDKFVNPRNGDPALLIQGVLSIWIYPSYDGNGMDPESLRRCISFGFSDKQSDSSIGQYGNGFKTSTMRLGADAIVLSRCMNKRVLTQSVGLLSYTFLRQTGCDDVVVPVVDYEFNPLTGTFGRLICHNEKQFFSNLSTILKWSPFSTEVELLNQFNNIDQHGTKIIVFNLWLNDDDGMELDFESDPEDILINGAHRKGLKKSVENILGQKYVANRLHYSLRVYSSVLYLRIPENFKIILRGQVVKHHYIAKDLIYRECIKYKPQVGGITEGEVLTTIGFLDGAPNVNVHGFNVYHRNRLILPFWRVAHNSYGKGRGVVGVLEANFIKPTHDKQDFEKSTVFQRLETRLKEMTYEYWDFHCHLVGYKSKNPYVINSVAAPAKHLPAGRQPVTNLIDPTCSTPGQTTNGVANYQKGLPQKRKYEIVADGIADGFESSHKTLLQCNIQQKRKQEVVIKMQENKKLLDQCIGYEESEKLLLLKAAKLRREVEEVQQVYNNLVVELKLMDYVKMEKL